MCWRVCAVKFHDLKSLLPQYRRTLNIYPVPCSRPPINIIMGNSWSELCFKALQRPLGVQLASTRAIFGVLVGFMLLSSACAAVCIFRFRRFSVSEQNRYWNRYQLFASLIFVGGVLGAVTWLCYMTSLSFNFSAQYLFQYGGAEGSLDTTRQFGFTYFWLG